ncbi:MAG: MFS transporter [Chloroflexota bacterium]|nr:MFS transporter [Chloroflexota bacterium]
MARPAVTANLLGFRVQGRTFFLVAAVVGHAMNHIFLSGSVLALPEIKAAMGLSNTNVGVIAAARDGFSGLISFPAGFVADRFASWMAAILGLSVIALGVFMFLVGISPSFWTVLIFMALLGLAIVFWHPPALGAVSAHYPEKRGFAIGMHGMGGSIGEATGPIILGLLLSVMLWRTALQLSIIPAVLVGIGVYLLVRAAPVLAAEPSARRYFAGVGAVLRNARLLLVLGTAACFSGTQIAIMSFLPVYAREDLGLSTTATGLMLSVLQIAGIGSQPVLGHLSDRIGRRVVLSLGFFGLTLGTLSLYATGEGLAFFASVALTGPFLFPMMAIILALGMDVVGRNMQGTTASIIFGVGIVLASFSGWMAGRVADTYSVHAVFLYAAAPASLALLFTLLGAMPFLRRSS